MLIISDQKLKCSDPKTQKKEKSKTERTGTFGFKGGVKKKLGLESTISDYY